MQSQIENTLIAGGRSRGHQFDVSALVISIAAIAGIAGWIAYGWFKGDLTSFIDWRAGLLVLAVPVLILTGIFGWAAPIDSFFYVLGRRDDSAAARDAAHFFLLRKCWVHFH